MVPSCRNMHVALGAAVTPASSEPPSTHAAPELTSFTPSISLCPQHHSRPSIISKHACDWPLATAITRDCGGLWTGVGATGCCIPRGTPTIACSLSPQHTTDPDRRRAHALNTPVAIWLASVSSLMNRGTELSPDLPSPSWPWLPRPQHA